MKKQLKAYKKLPKEVQTEVLKDLSIHNRTNVWFEYGRYEVTTENVRKAFYGADRKFIGSFAYDDLKDALPSLKAARAIYLAGCINIDWDKWLGA